VSSYSKPYQYFVGIPLAITTRLFGSRGQAVTQVGLGGEGVLRTYGRTPGAFAVIEEAAVQEICYFDSARVYADSESYYGTFWRKHFDLRPMIFQTSKSASRDKARAKADLKHSLATMSIHHLDLWQIHDIRTLEDIEEVEGPGGALEAFIEAKDTGLTKFIGVTGHHDPRILELAVKSWPVDAVLMPVNPVEAVLGGFLDSVTAAAEDRGMAIIGMKVLGASHYTRGDAGITPELLIRFALSQRITTAIVGCSSPKEVQALAKAEKDFEPMSQGEQNRLIELFRPYARELAFYRGVI
jgi:aryl-alcohol dehydrogenase-like predicted oxidoreductase